MLRYVVLCAALAACVDDPELSSVEQDVNFYCPGVTTTGVQTYRGLTGTYVRLGLSAPGEPLRLSLVAEQDDTDARGTFTGLYTGENGLPASYAGRFGALADNPAIGAFLALDTNSDEAWDDSYFVIGITRSLGRVRALCLVGEGQPFQLSRTLY
jgi:hypothetical protein